MLDSRRFFLYKTVPGKVEGKRDKLPISPRTLEVFDSTDAAHYVDLETARQLVGTGAAEGVGWSVAPPYFCLDIDGAAEPSGGAWKDIACRLVGLFPGCFVEVSQSGKGLHVIGRYEGPEPEHRKKRPNYHGVDLELYTSRRFIALTFAGGGSSDADGGAGLGWLIANLFQPDPVDVGGDAWTVEPVIEYGGPADDAELLELMLNSRGSGASILGGKATIRDLFLGDPVALAKFFPSDSQEFDRSSADLALASHLAFWTGKNCDRILRLIKMSGLARDKWDRVDYCENTIGRAVRGCLNVYGQRNETADQMVAPALVSPAHAPRPADVTASGATVRDGFQFIGIDQQLDMFKGCVYIRKDHKIMIPSGELLSPDQFKASYGGYIFALDATNSKITRNAFEAFTQSLQVKFPQASSTVFKPDEAPGAILTRQGFTYANTYRPIPVDRRRGDVSPFLDHLKKLVPVESDRLILLSYMAAIVQYPGKKIPWCPVIQGVEGNGKTLFSLCVANAVGDKYVHWPQADDIDNKFNAWILGKIFIGVEEIYLPEKPGALDILKPMITGAHGFGVQGKGKDQESAHICANFMMTTNHRDAIKKTANDRRFAIFYTVQQRVEDLARDNMTGDYFPRLYKWLQHGGGYAFVSEFLHTWQIPAAYNPIETLHRAPETSSTAAALEDSITGVEQVILEACDEGRPGFAGGWISSSALDRLLIACKADRRYPPRKRRELLEGIGYIAHPGLRDGRTASPSIVDGGCKPRLFVRKDSLAAQLSRPVEILDRYVAAQRPGDFDNQQKIV
jgi:hypothetical protein